MQDLIHRNVHDIPLETAVRTARIQMKKDTGNVYENTYRARTLTQSERDILNGHQAMKVPFTHMENENRILDFVFINGVGGTWVGSIPPGSRIDEGVIDKYRSDTEVDYVNREQSYINTIALFAQADFADGHVYDTHSRILFPKLQIVKANSPVVQAQITRYYESQNRLWMGDTDLRSYPDMIIDTGRKNKRGNTIYEYLEWEFSDTNYIGDKLLKYSFHKRRVNVVVRDDIYMDMTRRMIDFVKLPFINWKNIWVCTYSDYCKNGYAAFHRV